MRALVIAALFALAAGMLALVPLKAWGQDTWLAISTVSKHFPSSDGYNERNWGVGLEYGVGEDTRLVTGVYRNSYFRDTAYVGAAYTPFGAGPVRLGAVVGVVTGYEDQMGSRVAPAVLPVVTFESGNVGFNLIVAPQIGDRGGAALLQLKFRID
jgi:hypothetical protein